ncbi:hypothetical protein TNIN_228391 [Trichonephila inaurata madagascariensis]|uniref:Uncharacterized protein n=1 Tax=Trichonephila inaurata madagascariensis TaxID=2747483 RepID=A0A8X6Y6Y4_9ARAC|nr:hypothetical protein TNIN_228391 [Trichonephila inaurata madagascariensis]
MHSATLARRRMQSSYERMDVGVHSRQTFGGLHLQVSRFYPSKTLRSFLQYEKIDASYVITSRDCHHYSSFIQCGKQQVGQEIPYDYTQVFFRERPPFTAQAFNLLYTFPACYIDKNDQDAPEQYQGWYVFNPLHFTYGAYAEHPRFNDLLLKHERGDWTLEFAPEYDIDTYCNVVSG